MDTPKTFQYTTKNGYKFPYLTENPNKPFNGDYDLKDILEESTHYDQVYWARISKTYYEYLRQELHITEPDGENNCYFYTDLSEGSLTIRELPNDDSIDIILIIDNPLDVRDINMILYSKINRSSFVSFHKGLDTFLDSNYGGNINKNSLDIACLMIYG